VSEQSDRGAEAVGSVAEEAAKLLAGAQEWARRTFAEEPSGQADGSHQPSECGWCPLCRALSLLRGERPEATEKVVAAGTALLGAVQAWLESATPGPVPGDSAGADDRDAPRPRVQRIHLDGE
jgi:hypothetical protein